MESSTKTIISVEAIIDAPIETVWKNWISPQNIVMWNASSKDWHTTCAENDLRLGGEFCYRMEAKDGSASFDFKGKYEYVHTHEQISYTADDGRKVKIMFTKEKCKTKVVQLFEAENENPIEFQREGWQAILNSFKNYVEMHLREISFSKWKF
ncbi:SRPBCC domain-containing protein [Flavobacterium sp. Arc3]|jgi:uncharacterized protein YndB with AHSA1/START domain|uniref:SRPBCC domain-containing protein n=1 Tax=unclassified Flavobacterium TaxID=196869 RepID=UPI00352D8E13